MEVYYFMKTIGLVAHDHMKLDIVEWCVKHKDKLKNFRLLGTEGTAKRIRDVTGLEIGNIGHEHDIQTLIRTCTTQNILFTLNKATADFFLH